LKGERCGGDRGKGFFWSVDEKYAQALEEQEIKSQQTALANASGGKEGPVKGSRKKEKTALLEPPLKRSVKGDLKGAPLPPPLTSAPLSFKSTLSSTASSSASSIPTAAVGAIAISSPATTGVFAYPTHPHHANFGTTSQVSSALTSGYSAIQLTTPNPYAALTQHHWALHPSAPKSTTTTVISPSASTPTSFLPLVSQGPSNHHLPPQSGTPSTVPLVPDVVIPIILGPIPPTHTDYAPNHPNNSKKEGYMVLHERKLILDPDVFAGLTKEMLEEIEKMGAREALRVLTGHMIKALKERRAKGRGKERGGRRLRGAGGRGGSRKAAVLIGGPFTNVPLENRRSASSMTPADGGDSAGVLTAKVPAVTSMPESVPLLAGQDSLPADPGTPIVIIDDSDDEGPVTKRRKVESEFIVTS
jgi:forkhead box protein K